MAGCLSDRAKKLMTFLGGFLMLLPNGVTWYWGNVSIYVYSYFHHKNKTTHQDVRAPWLLSMFVINWGIAMVISEYVNRKIGRRLTLALGIGLFNGGLLGSYFVFSNSMTLLDLTMGFLGGFGTGLLHAMVLQTIVEWTTSHVGLATAFLLTSYAIGSTITNQLITHYLNPENKKVDVFIGGAHYFSQKEILDKVPSIFLGLCTCSGTLHILAFACLRFNQRKDAENTQKDEHHRKEITLTNPEKPLKISGPNTQEKVSIQIDPGYWQEAMSSPCEYPLNEDDSKLECSDKSPSQILRTLVFYVLWITVFGSDSAFMTLSNYYKIFGQVWIKDDHFLTNLGTTLALCTVLMRLFWGLITDFLGVKPAFVTLTSGLALVSTGYFFTAHLNKWLFFATTLLYGALNCGVYINFIVAVHNLYGRAHFMSNCGLMASATIVLNLTFPPFSQMMLSHFGWFALFFSVATLNFCCLILIICFLPER